MTRMRMVLIVGVLVAVAFLSGLIVGYMEVREVRQELQTTEQEVDRLQLQARLCQIRDFGGLMYLETSRQNYGLAAEHAGRYFNELRRLSQQDLPDDLDKAVSDLLNQRDAVISALARGVTGVQEQIQALYADTYRKTEAEAVAEAPGGQSQP